jgi:hypothetical protein
MNTNTSTKEAEALAELVCSECHCSIDACAFCDEAGCAVAVCYGCLIEGLGETAPQPHTHGG